MPDPNKPSEHKATNPEQDIRALLDRAKRGDTATLPALHAMLRRPEAVEQLGGNLAQQAEVSFVRALAGDNLMFQESLTRKLELLREELAGSNPTPLERLLVERIVACWLQVQDADVRYAQAKEQELKWWAYFQERMDRAHRRYLSAIKTLAIVRKLAVPVLQVNIARKQVNVANATIAEIDPLKV